MPASVPLCSPYILTALHHTRTSVPCAAARSLLPVLLIPSIGGIFRRVYNTDHF